MDFSYLDRNIDGVRQKMAAARSAAGREDEVTLLAAIKSADADEVNYLHREHGVCDVGENRVQQLLSRYDALDKENLRIHFIGSLQTNKVKYIIDKVYMIHSLDSLRLAAEVDKQAKKHGLVMRVLAEVNSGREESKGGLLPEEVEKFCLSLRDYPNLKLCGFMTMAPKLEHKEEYIKYFQEFSQLSVDIWTKKLDNKERPILSMGMSESYEEAIACGATVVRVGRTLFEK